MKKILISEHQADSLFYGLLNEQNVLTEGKFAESVKELARQYFPGFLEKITDDDLSEVERVFVNQQLTSGEARKWMMGMFIKGYGDMLMNSLTLYATAIKRFLANKALIELNGNESSLFTGNNEENFILNYTDVNEILSAAEPRYIVLLKRAVSEEGAGTILYEDDEVIAVRIVKTTPLQRAAQDIISGWCTKGSAQCDSYTNKGYLCDILYKGSGSSPFNKGEIGDDKQIINLYEVAGSTQIGIHRNFVNNFGPTGRDNYGDPVEIRNKKNVVIALGRLFNHYNPKLLTALTKGINQFISQNKMLFWYEYTSNNDTKRQFPESYINRIDENNKQKLYEAIKNELGIDGTLTEAGVMKYEYVTTENKVYTLSINNAISRSKIQTEYNPKEIFTKMLKKKMKSNIVIYNKIELMDLDKPETFFKYLDLAQMGRSNPLFASFAKATVSPEMIGKIMFNHYKQKFPGSSNIEIFNTYFEPFLNIDTLYNDYIGKLGPQSEERKITIKVPIFKHELVCLLLRSVEEIEAMNTIVFLDVDLVPVEDNGKITDTSGSME